jgi:DnaJ-class molecular chaperone
MNCTVCNGFGENEVRGPGMLFMVNCVYCNGTGIEMESPSGDDEEEI